MPTDNHPAANPAASGVSEREARFLDRLSAKYAHGDSAGVLRSYLIFAAVIGALFALALCIPWWYVGLLAVEVLGLALFRQYKRFSAFKTRLLRKLWNERKAAAP